MKICNTFILPIQEYCIPIWYRERAGLNAQLEWVHHQITRIALGTAHRPYVPNYVTYNDRCSRLGVPTFQARTKATQALSVIKLLKGIVDSDFSQVIQNSVNVGMFSLRTRNLFASDRRSIATGSPLDLCITAANELASLYSLDDNYLRIKNNIRHAGQ